MNQHLRGLRRGVFRLLLIGVGLGALCLGWRAVLRYGPGASAMFAFHAKALVRQRLAFPRPAPPVFLPEPQSMSSADVQLRLMKWWDGGHWLPEALVHGQPVKGGLQLRSGALILVEAAPVAAKADAAACLVQARIRWDFPEELQELHRVKAIIDLRMPKGLSPGQVGEVACSFTRKGWRWELVSATSSWDGRLTLDGPRPGPLDWVF